MQRAFLDRDAYQCGYCTPGQICSAIGVLDEAAQGWPSAVTPADRAAAEGPVTLDARGGARTDGGQSVSLRRVRQHRAARCSMWQVRTATAEVTAR